MRSMATRRSPAESTPISAGPFGTMRSICKHALSPSCLNTNPTPPGTCMLLCTQWRTAHCSAHRFARPVVQVSPLCTRTRPEPCHPYSVSQDIWILVFSGSGSCRHSPSSLPVTVPALFAVGCVLAFKIENAKLWEEERKAEAWSAAHSAQFPALGGHGKLFLPSCHL